MAMIYKFLGKTNTKVSAIGQGSMGVGGYFSPDASRDAEQLAALRMGIDAGMTFLDTAEIYGGGHSEELIGRGIQGMREKITVATKFSPEHSTFADVIACAEASLKRLGTNYIDLYQIHWPNPAVPIAETMRALEQLTAKGKIRHIGVSNFSLSQLKEARVAFKKHDIVSNQVEYNLFDRSIEENLLPYCECEGISIIAYSPLDQGKKTGGKGAEILSALATKYKKTASQIVLNWLVSHPSVVVIPKAISTPHILENASALDFTIKKEDLAIIDEAFKKEPLQVPVKIIRVSVQGEGARKVYQTTEEAIANKLNFCPSPLELASYIRMHGDENIKPVRLIHAVHNAVEKNDAYVYDLVEGRIRYWAWVLAFGDSRPIPAYLRE